MSLADDYLHGKPAHLVELFHLFMAAVEACGPIEVEPVPKGLVLHGTRRIFASVRPTTKGLQGHLNLPSRVEDPRIPKIEPLTKRLHFHRFALTSLTELDDDFVCWIRQAYSVGKGRHLL